MRQTEADYWDNVCRETTVDGISDNWLKRMALMSFFSKYNWMKERVLEIGAGSAVSAGILKISVGGMWSYLGTDVSPAFCEAAHTAWRLKVVQADVLSLPEGKFSRILALDSLEHVRPEDRAQGYDNIVDRMDKGAVMFINIPLTESQHVDEFDHGFDLTDLNALEKRGLRLEKYDTFTCYYAGSRRNYAMAILSK